MAVFLAACSAVSGPEIALDLANPGQPAVVINGLSRSDLASLDRAQLSREAWASVFRVSVAGNNPSPVLPVAGRYAVTGGTVRFTPMFPLDAGRRYQVVFDPAVVAGGQLAHIPKVSRQLMTPPPERSAPTTVAAVYPTGPAVPANLLRMYVEFSGPMGTRSGQDYITILNAKGTELSGALLPLDTDLWNRDHTRFTILFDPGRVKRGILPNRAMGRPLHPGDIFTIVVRREWPDAHAMALASEFRKAYRVGLPIERPLSTEHWRIVAPAAGSRDPLRVTFPAPLDHGLVRRALSVVHGDAEVPGAIHVENGETEWHFVPGNAWIPGEYAVSVLPVLEDPAGNRIGRAFEAISPGDDTQAPPIRVPFTVR